MGGECALASCASPIEAGDDYVVYGGIRWCSEDCLESFYQKHEEKFESRRKDWVWVKEYMYHTTMEDDDETDG